MIFVGRGVVAITTRGSLPIGAQPEAQLIPRIGSATPRVRRPRPRPCWVSAELVGLPALYVVARCAPFATEATTRRPPRALTVGRDQQDAAH